MLTRARAEPHTAIDQPSSFAAFPSVPCRTPPGPRMRGAPNFAERKVPRKRAKFF